MKKSRTYYRLALTGIVKNFRMYVPYLMTCAGMVMIYYILEFLARSKQVAALRGGDTLQTMFVFGGQVFAVFALIFLFYTNSFLLRSRKREFGLYNVLGMGKKHLARVMVWENVLVAGVSLIFGLFCGILFSKLAELWIGRVASGTVGMRFSIEAGAVKQTAALFLIIFALILLQALFQIGKAKPVELLKSEAAGEKPPKANWMLALLGVVLLGLAYYVAVSIEDPLAATLWFFLAVGVVIVATYLLFIAGSVALCRMLQRNKKYYYKVNHFVSVSSMVYRMKRNGAGLASICILSTMVLVTVSAATCLYVGSEEALLRQYPYDIAVTLRSLEKEPSQAVEQVMEDAFQSLGVQKEREIDYRYMSVEGIQKENEFILDGSDFTSAETIQKLSDIYAVYFIPLEDYNRIEGEQETLAENEVLIYAPEGYGHHTIQIEGCKEWSVKAEVPDFLHEENDMERVVKSLFVFLPDMAMADGAYAIQPLGRLHYYGYDVSLDEEGQQALTAQIQDGISALSQEDDFPMVTVNGRAAERARFHAVNGGMFVVGILLGVVFLVATVLLMYYKQITEGYEDQAKFDIMKKVGMTGKEIRASIRSQMLTVFLAPLLLAGLHTAFAFPMVQKLLTLFGAMNVRLLIAVTGCCFLVFVVFYMIVYFVTSRSYYRIVNK